MPSKGLDYIAADPVAHGREYATLAATASVEDVDAVIADFHALCPEHPYPAALFDPAGRTGRSSRGITGRKVTAPSAAQAFGASSISLVACIPCAVPSAATDAAVILRQCGWIINHPTR